MFDGRGKSFPKSIRIAHERGWKIVERPVLRRRKWQKVEIIILFI